MSVNELALVEPEGGTERYSGLANYPKWLLLGDDKIAILWGNSLVLYRFIVLSWKHHWQKTYPVEWWEIDDL